MDIAIAWGPVNVSISVTLIVALLAGLRARRKAVAASHEAAEPAGWAWQWRVVALLAVAVVVVGVATSRPLVEATPDPSAARVPRPFDRTLWRSTGIVPEQDDQPGLKVAAADEPACFASIHPGGRIVQINDIPIKTLDEAEKAIKTSPVQIRVLLRAEDGSTGWHQFRLDKPGDGDTAPH